MEPEPSTAADEVNLRSADHLRLLMAPAISIKGLHKHYPQARGAPLEVLRDFSLDIQEGEFVCLFGPNGCGKSTLLNVLSGLEPSSRGHALIRGKPPIQAKAGFVFQDYTSSLFPWRTVEGNVRYALECSGKTGAQANTQAREALGQVDMIEHAQKYPYELSGGLRQRTAIARALAYEPDVLLLDEPFSALDFETRLRMEEELLRVWSEQRITTLCVSHDVDEAVFLADRVVVLGARPSRVKGIVEVDLPRPRTMATRVGKRFYELRNKVLTLFKGEYDYSRGGVEII